MRLPLASTRMSGPHTSGRVLILWLTVASIEANGCKMPLQLVQAVFVVHDALAVLFN